MENKDNLAELIRMCCRETDVPDAELQQRIMLHTLTRAIEKSRRRSRVSLLSSLAAAVVSFCCVVFLMMNYLPARILIIHSFDWTNVTDKLQLILPQGSAAEWIQTASPLAVLVLPLLLMATIYWIVNRTFYS